MVLIYRPLRDPLRAVTFCQTWDTPLSQLQPWLCVQLTIMANNTISLSSSHCGPSDNGQGLSVSVWGNFPEENKKHRGLLQKCGGSFENFNISISQATSIASLITQVRLEKCCWSEIEYIRNPINDFGCLLAGLVSPRQNIMNFKAISQILSEKNCN